MSLSLAQIRREYAFRPLLEAETDPNPIKQFDLWFQEAVTAECPDPTVATLATATPEGRPSARLVLLKEFDERGFVFYTNYLSPKGQDLGKNPWAALCFWWQALSRQVRVEGPVEHVSIEESVAYFATRPLGSQIGALVSRQSQPRSSREELLRAWEAASAIYNEANPPSCPAHWGGYRLKPDRIEFWQGQPSRLHDRLLYTREGKKEWVRVRIDP